MAMLTTALPNPDAGRFVKVRVEEVLIGALVGAGTGLAVTAPFTVGLPSLDPFAAGIGLVAVGKAALLWAGVLAGGGLGAWWAGHQERDSHLRGARYYPDPARAAPGRQALERAGFSPAQRAGQVRGAVIGGVELSRGQETRHIVVVGKTGSGKTVLLTDLIDQLQARGDRCLIHDPKGDFTARYLDPRSAVLLGPWDDRATLWDAAADVATPALADAFAQSCVGEVQGENKSFYDNAAKVIAGLLKSFMIGGQAWTWAEFAAALELPPAAMAAQALKGDPHVAGAVPSAFRADGRGLNNGDSSTFAIVASGTRWVANYAAVYAPDKPHFSITRWLLGSAHADVRTVLLNNNAQYATAAKAIFGAILQSAVAVVNSASMPERGADAPDALWVIADELPQAGPATLEALQKLAELGRSRGIRLVEAMQDETQLAAAVGHEKAAPMLAVQGARIYLQCSDETAKAVSERVGEREVNRIETSAENGATQGKLKHVVSTKVLEPAALTGLRQGPGGVEAILHVNDTLGRVLVSYPERRPPIAAPLVESDAWKFGTLPGWQAQPAAPEPRAESEPDPAAPDGGKPAGDKLDIDL